MRFVLLIAIALGLAACDSTGVDDDRAPGDGLPAGTVQIDARQTYLRTSSDRAVDAPAVLLTDLGVEPGAEACFELLGDYFLGPGTLASAVLEEKVTAVFARTPGLFPPSYFERLVSPIDAGDDVFTGPTFNEDLQTDIPSDFAADDVCVTVPTNARYVFFSTLDSFYADNTDARVGDLPLRIRVTQG